MSHAAPTQLIIQPMTVGDLAHHLGVPVTELIMSLLRKGMMCNVNYVLPEEVVLEYAQQHGVPFERPREEPQEALVKEVGGDAQKLETRSPVVVVLGHVDHGKTSLLDYIRKTRVVAKEKGGITQHVGAYQADTKHGPLTFIDTPGHEAFSKIRARGAKAADIAVLVVAADDSLMPQTREAIDHAREAKMPIIVAINKIDKVDPARIDVVKRDLAAYNLLPEDWGGDIICVPISAKEGTGVDQLLELISLQAQMMELQTDVTSPARGFVLESRLEKGRGPVATVICHQGTLRVGDFFVAGDVVGKATSLVNSAGERVTSAGPSVPVLVAGFDELPDVGALFKVVSEAEFRKLRSKKITQKTATGLRPGDEKTINLIIKADSVSTLEAVIGSLERTFKKADKKLYIVHSAVGDITESDVVLAANTGSTIFGLHVKTQPNTQELAQRNGVAINLHEIIYKLIEQLQDIIEGAREIKMVDVKIGQAEVRKVFDIKSLGVIAGCYVQDGRFTRDGKVVILRDGRKIGEGKIKSLQRDRKTVKEVHTGFECAFLVEGFNEWSVGDIAECYIQQPEK